MTDDTQLIPPVNAAASPEKPVQARAPRRLPYSDGKRVGYGVLWAVWTAVLAIGGFAVFFGGQILSGLVVLILAAIAGRYDYRIWTWRARRLLFFIIW